MECLSSETRSIHHASVELLIYTVHGRFVVHLEDYTNKMTYSIPGIVGGYPFFP